MFKNIEIILIRNKVMGQKCCRPAIRQNPKHTELLNLIYTETPQNVKKMDHEDITEYLNKKGYAKTLSDYLSSHLYLINSSFVYCKTKLISNRSKKPFTQLYFSFLTSQVALKITLMCRQVKLIYYNKNNPNLSGKVSSKNRQGRLDGVEPDLMSHNKQLNELRQDTKGKLKGKHVKLQFFQRQFLEQDINLIILDICNQMLKQTINTKYFLSFQAKQQSTLSEEEATIQKTLLNVQKILYSILSERQGSFIKINYSVIKQILDNQTILLVMSNTKSNQQNNYFLPTLNVGRQSKRSIEGQLQNEQLLYPNNNLLNNINKIPNLTFPLDQAYNFRTLCLQNYSRLLYKAKINQANINLSKDIVKIHLPILLEMWANLMIENKSFVNIRKMEAQIKRDIILQKNAELKKSKDKAKQRSKEVQIDEDEADENKNKNISHMQLIIQSIIFELFNSYFSLKESEYIYKELILIFDKLCFNESQILSIQRLVFIALSKHELKDFVMSKWFDYLLDYLAIITTFTSPHQVIQNSITPELFNSNQLHFFEKGENYLSGINLIANPQIERSQYTNWRKQQNIEGCLRTIIRWISQGQVDIQSIINFKHNKMMFAVLANLAWGSSKINKKIYQLVEILIQNNIRCFEYLVNICALIINRLRIGYIVDIQYDWRYFIAKWEQDKLKINKGNQFDEKSKIQRANTLKLRVKRKTVSNQHDTQIQLISIEKYIDELIQMTCYPFLFKIKQDINANSLQIISQEDIKKSNKRYSSLGEPFLKLSQNNGKEDEINEKPIRNIKNSTFEQIQKNSLSHYSLHLYHFRSSMQIPEIDAKHHKRSIDPRLFYSVFSETLQQLFKNIKFHHHHHDKNCRVLNEQNKMGCVKRQSSYWQVKLTSLIVASNLITMVKLIGDNSDKKSRQTDFNHILHLTGILNKFFAKLCRELKYHSELSQKKQVHKRSKNSISMNGSFDIQRQSIDYRHFNLLNQYQMINTLPRESLQQNQNKSFDKQHKLRNKNINMISTLLDIIHIWMYPAITYLLEYSSLLKNYSNDPSQGQQTDSLNIKHTKLMMNIITKLYYKNLLEIAAGTLNREIHLNYGRIKADQILQKYDDSRSSSESSISEIKSKQNWKNQSFDHLEDRQENEMFLELRQKFMTTFLSVLQVYSIFFLFYNQCTKRRNSNDNIFYSNKSNAPTTANSVKDSMNSHLKRNGQQRQFLNKLKKNEQNLKNYEESINKEINNKVKNRNVLANSKWQEIILQTQSILNDNKISEMILLIDEVTLLQENELQQFKAQNRKILRSINSHIFKESDYKEMNSIIKDSPIELQHYNIQPSQTQEKSKCFSFQKTKKKILKAFNRMSNLQSTPQNSNLNMESKSNKMTVNESKLETKATEIPQLQSISQQNAQTDLPKIIDYFSQSYKQNQINRLGTKSNDEFNFGLSLEKGQDSVVNSSNLKEQTLEESFAEVLSEIKKS